MTVLVIYLSRYLYAFLHFVFHIQLSTVTYKLLSFASKPVVLTVVIVC